MGNTIKGKGRLVFRTEAHELDMSIAASGLLAVMTPEWDRMALILDKSDIENLATLCKEALSK